MRPTLALLRARSRVHVVADNAAAIPQSQSYAIASGFFAALLGVIGYTFVYIPNYSTEAIEARERAGLKKSAAALDAARAAAGIQGGDHLATAEVQPTNVPAHQEPKAMPFTAALSRDNAPGSMWRSISSAREIKEVQAAASSADSRTNQ